MADLYNSQAKLNGVFRGTNFALSVATSGGVTTDGALIQDFSVQYARMINRIYELGTANQYYIEGATQGNAAISQIVGPSDVVSAIVDALSDICTAAERSVSLSAGMKTCDGQAARSLTLGNAVISNFQMGGSAANFTVSSSAGIMFTRLDLN
jgi:hypothetical protein